MRREPCVMSRRSLLALGLCVGVGAGCATAPKPTEASRRVAANPPAIVEGIVRDEAGKPVAGIGVRGIPSGKDVPWSPVVETGCDGRFRLVLAAPAAYSFVLLWRGTGVITPDPRDPSRRDRRRRARRDGRGRGARLSRRRVAGRRRARAGGDAVLPRDSRL